VYKRQAKQYEVYAQRAGVQVEDTISNLQPKLFQLTYPHQSVQLDPHAPHFQQWAALFDYDLSHVPLKITHDHHKTLRRLGRLSVLERALADAHEQLPHYVPDGVSLALNRKGLDASRVPPFYSSSEFHLLDGITQFGAVISAVQTRFLDGLFTFTNLQHDQLSKGIEVLEQLVSSIGVLICEEKMKPHYRKFIQRIEQFEDSLLPHERIHSDCMKFKFNFVEEDLFYALGLSKVVRTKELLKHDQTVAHLYMGYHHLSKDLIALALKDQHFAPVGFSGTVIDMYRFVQEDTQFYQDILQGVFNVQENTMRDTRVSTKTVASTVGISAVPVQQVLESSLGKYANRPAIRSAIEAHAKDIQVYSPMTQEEYLQSLRQLKLGNRAEHMPVELFERQLPIFFGDVLLYARKEGTLPTPRDTKHILTKVQNEFNTV